jgi:CRISPR/Cas system-associated exonuclease Cas4 (RecB family)
VPSRGFIGSAGRDIVVRCASLGELFMWCKRGRGSRYWKAQKARDEATAENTKLQEQLEDEKREIEKLKDQLELDLGVLELFAQVRIVLVNRRWSVTRTL